MKNYNTKELVEKYNVKTKKSWGQNFISDTNIIEKMVNLSMVNKDSVVIEIGPGLGILTKSLAEKAKRVIAFEIDKNLVNILNDIFKERNNIEIVEGDFLKVKLQNFVTKKEYKKLVVCANLPYYITTPILFKLFESDVEIPCISIMMQKEVAQRFTGKQGTKDYNALTVITQYKYDTKIIMKVAKEIFYPMPKVDSAVVLFKRKPKVDAINEVEFFNMVKSCFKYRRKTIYNNYREEVGDLLAQKILKKAEIALSIRAEQLSLTQYLKLFEVYSEEKSFCES